MILVFYAFAREIAPFRRRVRNRRPLAHEGLRGFSGSLGGKNVTAVGHGIGHGRATEAARRAFDEMANIELAIGTGVVGALSGGLKPGDLVMADRIMVIHADGKPAEQVCVIDDAQLRSIGRTLAIAGISYSTGAILTAHRVLNVGAEKRLAKESTGAIAVDMETSALAVEANARGIPFVMLRAVLDEVDEEIVGAEMADEHGRVRPLAATSFLVRNPGAVLKLPRMIRNLASATAAIADALEAIAHDGKVPGVKNQRAAARKRPH